jgi:D-alanine-D-alanine ligase
MARSLEFIYESELMKKPKSVWVLYGGSSKEREVSLRSGKGIFEALKTKGFQTSLFDVRPGLELKKLNWANPPDIVFVGLHGTFGEDGVIQGFLEAQNIPFVGSGSTSSALSFHKGLTKKLLSAFGVSTPEGFDIRGLEGFENLEKNNKLPAEFFKKDWFIKPAREGSTVGIERYEGNKSESPKNFKAKLSEALKFDPYVLVEEWIRGVEVTIPILLGKALPSVEIRPLSQFYDYESKYTKGKTEYFSPAHISPELEKKCAELAEQTFQILECKDYGRVDILIGPQGPRVLEMNTLPGMTETSLVPKSARAAGLEYADFLEKLVISSFERQMMERESAEARAMK